jgi:hypothetical protein
MKRLDQYNVTLNNKSKFAQTTLRFLGHTISNKGIQIDDDKFKAITNACVPRDVKSLRSFLGLAGYFARHVKSFADVVEPLRVLMRNGSKFDWTTEADTRFNLVKKLVGGNVTLSMFDPDLDVIVTTDASQYGLGGVLSQIRDGQEIPIAFA